MAKKISRRKANLLCRLALFNMASQYLNTFEAIYNYAEADPDASLGIDVNDCDADILTAEMDRVLDKVLNNGKNGTK